MIELIWIYGIITTIVIGRKIYQYGLQMTIKDLLIALGWPILIIAFGITIYILWAWTED